MATDPDPAAAFEVAKGRLEVLFLGEDAVRASIDPAALLDALSDGFADCERGIVQTPGRPGIDVPGKGFSLTMSAWRPGDLISVKVVNVFEGNLEIGLPNHLAMITLFDSNTGATVCMLDGTFITGIRTAAAAVLSARLLSRPDSKVATIVGAGVQALEHLRLLPLIRDLDHVNICSLHASHAERLAELSPLARYVADVDAAVAESDIVCLTTHSPRPVIDARRVRPGTHVTSVGYCPPAGELPVPLIARGALFVETLDALQPPPVGCSELQSVDPAAATTIGAVVLGTAPGRTADDQITVYKAMGIAMEDMVAANLAYRCAVARRVGVTLRW